MLILTISVYINTNFRRNSNSYETAFLYLSFFHVIQTVQIDRTERCSYSIIPSNISNTDFFLLVVFFESFLFFTVFPASLSLLSDDLRFRTKSVKRKLRPLGFDPAFLLLLPLLRGITDASGGLGDLLRLLLSFLVLVVSSHSL